MNILKLIFAHLMTFMAGGMCFVNLAALIPEAGFEYEASWLKVAMFGAIGIFASIAAYAHTTYCTLDNPLGTSFMPNGTRVEKHRRL
jgi:zinc transporter ZupT